jgi:predicted nucleotidyltransferase
VVTRPPLKEWIERQDGYARRRHAEFRRAAEAVAAAFAERREVRAIWLFGSVARAPRTTITRRDWEMLHHCKDVDLAVWVDRLDDLAGLNAARSQAVSRLFSETGIGVAHHQVDVFLFEPGSDRYLGRLCTFAVCPKGKLECQTPGCGRAPLLKQHHDFNLDSRALAEDRVVRLFDRGAQDGAVSGG